MAVVQDVVDVMDAILHAQIHVVDVVDVVVAVVQDVQDVQENVKEIVVENVQLLVQVIAMEIAQVVHLDQFKGGLIK